MKSILFSILLMVSAQAASALTAREAADQALNIMRQSGAARVNATLFDRNYSYIRASGPRVDVKFFEERNYVNVFDTASQRVDMGALPTVFSPLTEEEAVIQLTQLIALNANMISVDCRHTGYRLVENTYNIYTSTYEVTVVTTGSRGAIQTQTFRY